MEAACDSQTCPATAPETRKALPVLSVSALPVLSVSALSVLSVSVPPRSQTLPWFPAWSAFLRWSPASVWWSTAQVWWSSALPWWSSARVWWSSAPPWWSSTPVWWFPVPPAPPWWALVPSSPAWWAPVPSSLPWLPALPQFPASPLAHGSPPPPVPPPLHQPPGSHESVWKPLHGGGYVTNPGHELPPNSHQRSLVQHIDSYTTLLLPFTIELHFPSSTAPTQLFALITHTPENYLTITITQSHRLYKPGTSSRITPSIV